MIRFVARTKCLLLLFALPFLNPLKAQIAFENLLTMNFDGSAELSKLKARNDGGYHYISEITQFPGLNGPDYSSHSQTDVREFYLARFPDSTLFLNFHDYQYRDMVEFPDSTWLLAGAIQQQGAYTNQSPFQPTIELHNLGTGNPINFQYQFYTRGTSNRIESFHGVFPHPSAWFAAVGNIRADNLFQGGGVFYSTLDSMGNVLSTTVHIYGDNHRLIDVAPMPDGGAVFGSNLSPSLSGSSVYLLAVDSTGAKRWSTEIPNFGITAIETNSQGDIYTLSDGPSGVVTCFDHNGILKWGKSVGNLNLGFQDIASTQDGGVVIACSFRQNINAYNQRSMLKLDSVGNWVWGHFYQGGTAPNSGQWSHREGKKIAESPTGEIYMASQHMWQDTNNVLYQGLDILRTSSGGLGCNSVMIFSSTNNFTPNLVAAQDTSYTDTVFQTVSIGPPYSAYLGPAANFAQVCSQNLCGFQFDITSPGDTFCLGDTITFSGTSQGSSNATYYWTFGSSPLGFADSVSIVAGSPGNQSILMTGLDSLLSCTTSIAKSFFVVQPNLSLGPDYDVCEPGLAQASIPPNYATYLWSTGDTTSVAQFSSPGSVWVTVTDQFGCEDGDTLFVGVDSFSIDLGADTTLCPGDLISLDPGPGGATYLWGHGPTSQTIMAGPGQAYSVSVINANNCLRQDSITLSAFPTPTISLGNDTLLCAGNTVTLDAGPGFVSYQWSNGDSASQTSVSIPNTYTILATDANGCQASDTIMVGVDSLNIDLGNDTLLCQGNTVTLQATPGLASYTWSNGDSAFSTTVTGPANFSLVATDSNGCVGVDTIFVGMDSFSVDLGPDSTLCPGDSLVLDAGSGGTSYSWAHGPTLQTIFGVGGQSYAVTVVNGNNCVGQDTIQLGAFPAPAVNLGNDTMLCPGDSLTLQANPGFPFYQWSTGGTSSSITVSGANTYSVTVTDSNNCHGSDDLVIGAAPVPVGAFVTNVIGDTVEFFNFSTGATSFLWLFGDGNSSTSAIGPVHVYAPGNYMPCLIVTNGFGCSDTTCRTVSIIVGQEDELDPRMILYPNPGDGKVKVYLPEGQIEQWNLYSPTGKLVRTGEGLLANELLLDLSSLASGAYHIEIWSLGRIHHATILIQP